MKTRTHNRRGDHASGLTSHVSSVWAVASTLQSLVEREPASMGSMHEHCCIIGRAQAEHVFGCLRTDIVRPCIEFLLQPLLNVVSEQHRAADMDEPRTGSVSEDKKVPARHSFGAESPECLRNAPYRALRQEHHISIARISDSMRDFYNPFRGELVAHELANLIEGTHTLAELDLRYDTLALTSVSAPDLPLLICTADQVMQISPNHIPSAMETISGGALKIRTAAWAPVFFLELALPGSALQTTCASVYSRRFLQPGRPNLGLAYHSAPILSPNMEDNSACKAHVVAGQRFAQHLPMNR